MYDIAMINLGHYRNSADYEDSVFWCGQAQPYISGLNEQWRDHMEKNGVYVGSRAPMLLPAGGAFAYAQPLPNTLVKEAKEGMSAEEEIAITQRANLHYRTVLAFDWSLPVPYSKEAITELLLNNPALANDVERLASDRARFFAPELKAS